MSIQVDWSDPAFKLSRHFTVHETINLAKWGRLATPRDGLTEAVKQNILVFANTMDKVADYIGQPLIVHRWFSPTGYNALVGGKPGSKHLSLGPWSAVDFHVDIPSAHDVEEACRRVRLMLEPKLEEFGIRMEKHDGPWVHLDNAPVVYNRYFKP